MLALSIALAVAAVAIYVEVPSMLIYWAYPWPVYALLIASMACAFASGRRGILRWATFGGTTFIASLFIFYTAYFSRLAPHELTLGAGDPFPELELQTSTGEWFSPAQIKGKKAALYIFYRGDW